MTETGDDRPQKDDTDILSAIRRIVDEESGAPGAGAGSAPSAQVPAAPAPAPAGDAPGRAALVLTPTMRVNAPEGDPMDDPAPLVLTNRVDAQAPSMGDGASTARDLREAFGREEAATPEPAAPWAEEAPADEPEQSGAGAQPGAAAFGGFAEEPAQTPPPPAPETPKTVIDGPDPFSFDGPDTGAGAPPVLPELGELASMSKADLEGIITEQLRKDLSGELGARISANIRALVQREVERAVQETLSRR